MPKHLLINNPTIGADIEVFLQKDNNEVISAEGIIKGTKEFPYNFRESNKFFATSLDNVMAEFCIPPAQTMDEFAGNIEISLKYIDGILPRGIHIKAAPSAFLAPYHLQSEAAKTFGCDPDYNAWLMGVMNPKPVLGQQGYIANLRTAGGHIHIGYESPDYMVSMSLIRAMDIHLGLPAVIEEAPNKRKELYGKAGAFRVKPYGTEYRTISNYFLSSPELIKKVYERTMDAINFVNQESPIATEEGDAVQQAINTGNKELAKTMCDYFGVKIVK